MVNLLPVMRWSQTFFALSIVFASSVAWARPRIEVSADPSRSRNGEPVHFKIHIEHEGSQRVRAPELKPSDDWEMVNSFQAQIPSTTIMNGKITFRFRGDYSFIMRPLKKGHLKLPEAKMLVDGVSYSVPELYVDVDRSTAGGPGGATAHSRRRDDEPQDVPQGGGNSLTFPGYAHNTDPDNNFSVPARESFFIRAEPTKTKVYKGQLIVTDYALYQRGDSNINNPEIAKFPDFKNFLKEELNIPRTFSRTPVTINGEQLFRSEIFKYALFPMKEGKLTVEPMQFRAEVFMNPMDMLNNLVNGQPPNIPPGGSIPMVKSSNPVVVNVKMLPNIPDGAGFTGGVGEFKIELKAPDRPVAVNQPFSVTLTIAGSGNVKAIEEPKIQVPSEFEQAPTKSESQMRPDATGFKSFEYLLIPRKPGAQKIPAIQWTYFDPEKEQYVNLKTEDISISVEGSLAVNDNDKKDAAKDRAFGVSVGTQKFVETKSIRSLNVFASPFAFFLEACALGGLIFLFTRRRQDTQREAFYEAQPWEKTAVEIRNLLGGKIAGTNVQMAILVDQWMRERLAGYIRSDDIHDESPRDEVVAKLRAILHPEYHKNLDPLKRLWSDLDIIRFSGTKKAGPPDAALFKKAEEILSRIVMLKKMNEGDDDDSDDDNEKTVEHKK